MRRLITSELINNLDILRINVKNFCSKFGDLKGVFFIIDDALNNFVCSRESGNDNRLDISVSYPPIINL